MRTDRHRFPASDDEAPAGLREPRNTFCIVLFGAGVFSAFLGAVGSRDSSNSATMLLFIAAGFVAMLAAVAGVDNWRDRWVLLAVTLVVALFTYPNYTFGRRRATLGAVYEDMRANADSLSAYRARYGSYPPWSQDAQSVNGAGFPSFRMPQGPEGSVPSFAPVYDVGAFFTSGILPNRFFRDPFAPKGKTFNYVSAPGHCVLWSPGPDREYRIDAETLRGMADWRPGEGEKVLLAFEYDPTNGSRSAGDIVRLTNDD